MAELPDADADRLESPTSMTEDANLAALHASASLYAKHFLAEITFGPKESGLSTRIG